MAYMFWVTSFSFHVECGIVRMYDFDGEHLGADQTLDDCKSCSINSLALLFRAELC